MHKLPEPDRPPGEFLPSPSVRRERPTLPATYTEVPYSAGPDPGFEPEGGGLLEYWRILRRRKGTLILIASIGTLIGFLVTLPQTPIYQARTSVEIVGLNQNFLNVREASPLTEGGTSSDVADIQTKVRILQSESLMDRVIEHVAAVTPQSAEVSRISAWRKALNLPEPEPLDARAQALGYAKKNLKVRAMGQTRIIEITVDSMSPAIATNFANSLTNEFIDQTLESRFRTTERTGEFLTRQIDDMRVRLEQSEDRLQQYANRAGLIIFTDEKTNVSSEKLSQVQQSLSAAQADRILKQARWEIANSSPPEALSDVLNDTTLRDYQAKLTELNRQLAELKQTYTDEALQVKRVLAQVAPVQAALSRAKNDILKRIRNEYEEAQRREKLLEADYTVQRGVVTGEGGKAIQYNILKREVESSRQLYDAMLQQLKQASLASALRASNIRVVDPAKVPKTPYKPDVPMSSGLGMLSGLFLGAAFVIMLERANRSIQDPGETARYTNLPELGIIPQDRIGRVRVRVTGNSIGKQLSAGKEDSSQSALALAPQRTELATLQRRPSVVAESFRATLVSILFSGENGSRPRTMVVTSCGPAEGKSTVVSNLGIAVAEVGQKVLLIDADLRKPRLHEIFHLKNDKGLSDILRSKDLSDGLPEGVIQETDVPALFVLTSGSTTSTATSLLYSNRMPELLKKLRTEFETIFVDTPPMLQIPDARVIGRMVDRVILVVRAGKTTRDAISAAHQRFSEDGTQVLGTVLNDWNPKNSGNGYYGDYNGYYSGYYKRGYYASKGSSDE